MAMKKTEAVEILTKAGIPDKEIKEMKWTELRKKAAEVLAEEETIEEEKVEETVKKKKKKEKETKKEEAVEEPVKEEELEKFESPCGFEFDPSETSECYMECRIEYPDDYKECVDHHKKMQEVKKKAKEKKKGGGTTAFGHKIKAQSGQIDLALLEDEEPVDLKSLAEELGTTLGRVKGHVKVLIKDKDVDVKQTKDGFVFLPDRFENLEGTTFTG